MEREEKIPFDEGRGGKGKWDEYSILNDSICKERGTDKGSSLEWRSYRNEECNSDTGSQDGVKTFLSEEAPSAKKQRDEEENGKENGRPLVSGLRKSVSGNSKATGRRKGEEPRLEWIEGNGSSVCPGIQQNVSKQRYEEHMRRSEYADAEDKPRCEVSKGNLEDVQVTQIQKEENMRKVLRAQEGDLWAKDQEILLLKEKMSMLESRMEISGKEYVAECVLRGEAAVKMLEEEIKKERAAFLERIGEEVEKSRMLSKRIEGLKKIINELVRKIKRMKQKAEGSRTEDVF
ncbi:hypothetical protein [Encephalitozoon cuniculi GB-M1]|uniref:Uncharacterized protein n=2 Tax=Encephalitozoon cuniculi TaxID=6035 RepID=Q8STR0_ENCCU|nr:uncharacterized protein ECU09_1080 [Encephalitozoon cuniculi GB-M1]AGE96612.1 hypothetical protein ECU09_1080 [Encephalitozoon cuniculi]KMV65473.1 hypothetical protein M970_091110 [Encephalitozoon cuniculi EcunIII-L]UYI26797.1 hypothetical protein J0A71_03g06340 [Encephalitozoon cuniculi]CAD27082.1 hypothetical protein [Encephalitozoon cuniculi GB-M1]